MIFKAMFSLVVRRSLTGQNAASNYCTCSRRFEPHWLRSKWGRCLIVRMPMSSLAFTRRSSVLWRRCGAINSAGSLIIVFEAEVGDQVFAAHPAQRVFELHQLDEDVVLGIDVRRVHWRLEVERQPFLDSAHAGAMRQVHEQHEVEHERRG